MTWTLTKKNIDKASLSLVGLPHKPGYLVAVLELWFSRQCENCDLKIVVKLCILNTHDAKKYVWYHVSITVFKN